MVSNMFDLAQIILNVISFSTVAAIFAVYIVKKIPAIIGEASKQFLDFHLKRELEQFKFALSENLELLKIIKSNVEPEKIRAFVNFTNYYSDVIAGKRKISDVENKRFHIQAAVNLFFFASDTTIKKYQSMKTSQDNNTMAILYSELILEMRKDLGYKETTCTANDFMTLILKK